MSHANAALTPVQRLRLARLIVDDGLAGRARGRGSFHVSWPTAKRWADRYRGDGRGRHAGPLVAAAPVAEPDPAPVVRKIVHLRWKQRLGPVAIGGRLGHAGLDGARGAGAVPAEPALPRRPAHR